MCFTVIQSVQLHFKCDPNVDNVSNSIFLKPSKVLSQYRKNLVNKYVATEVYLCHNDIFKKMSDSMPLYPVYSSI